MGESKGPFPWVLIAMTISVVILAGCGIVWLFWLATPGN